MLGAWYLETGRWPQARAELTKAMALFDRDPAVAYNLGIGYFGAGEYSRAFQMFETVQRVMPGVLDAKTKMALALAAEGRLGEARDVAADALKDKSDDPAALQAIVRAAALAEKVARSEARAR
jgi:Flp pilus assembly protein TadD